MWKRLCSQTGFRELWAGRHPLERLTRLPKIGPKGDLSGNPTNRDLANSMQLGKTPDGHLFVGVHLKDFVQLSDLQHAMYLFRRIQQL